MSKKRFIRLLLASLMGLLGLLGFLAQTKPADAISNWGGWAAEVVKALNKWLIAFNILFALLIIVALWICIKQAIYQKRRVNSMSDRRAALGDAALKLRVALDDLDPLNDRGRHDKFDVLQPYAVKISEFVPVYSSSGRVITDVDHISSIRDLFVNDSDIALAVTRWRSQIADKTAREPQGPIDFFVSGGEVHLENVVQHRPSTMPDWKGVAVTGGKLSTKGHRIVNDKGEP